MKKVFRFFMLALIAGTFSAAMTACSDDDDDAKQYPLTVSITLPDSLTAEHVSNVSIDLTRNSRTTTYTLSTVKDTMLMVKEGQYTVTVNGYVDGNEYTTVLGSASVDHYGQGNAVTVTMGYVSKSPLVFKTIYTNGGAQYYMLDSYFEIVNNSDEVQYLDGLILSAPMGNQKSPNGWQANGYTDLYANGQGAVVAFPGSGHDYPLQPGEFVVIANEATNHKLAYGEETDKADDYAKCPDLSNADWEIYLGTGDVDYAAPNLDVIYSNNRYMKAFGLGVMGRSYILAKLPEGMTPQQFAADSTNIMGTPGTSAFLQYLMIPSKYVLDAVDLYNPTTEESEHVNTFLPQDDAAGAHCSDSYAGKANRRKVSRIVNGRVYYQDTNNSKNDWKNNQDNTPSYVPTAVD